MYCTYPKEHCNYKLVLQHRRVAMREGVAAVAAGGSSINSGTSHRVILAGLFNHSI